jgi:hypothetical protein
MPAPAKPTNRPVAPKQQPPPIQRFQFTKEDFSTDAGVARVNAMMAQHATAVQALQGSGGRTTLFSGLDVQGETVTGVGSPQGPSDAVSLAHANGNYSAPAVGPQLDIGGSNALPGLSSIYLQMTQAFSGTIALAKLTTLGANGSITVANGLITKVMPAT